jgi:hypothetical protein
MAAIRKMENRNGVSGDFMGPYAGFINRIILKRSANNVKRQNVNGYFCGTTNKYGPNAFNS